jgi:hypothetical protein
LRGWSVPRELLWALIGALVIAIVALWPTQYPYRQAPKINAQHQTENGISGTDPAQHRPAPQVDPSREYERQHSGQNAAEISILGIKPGEWLLSIVTLMLWGATVGLVRSAERTAERQLRAYFDLKSASVLDFVENGQPVVMLGFENVGETPAKDVVCRLHTQIRPISDQPRDIDVDPSSSTASKSAIGRGGALTTSLSSQTLTRDLLEQYNAANPHSLLRGLFGTKTFTGTADICASECCFWKEIWPPMAREFEHLRPR